MDISNIVDEIIDPQDLQNLRQTYEEQIRRGQPSAIAAFGYAHGLIRGNKRNVRMGIQLLEDLMKKEEEDITKREYVYYLAVAHTRIKEFDRALIFVDLLLNTESHNRQVTDLKKLIEKRMRNEGLLGAAILGGGMAIFGGLLLAAIIGVGRRAR